MMRQWSTDPNARRLSEAEKQQFHSDGYVKNLPLFDAQAVSELQVMFRDMAERMPDGVDISRVNNWHKCSPTAFSISRVPQLLDYVQDLLGPNFFQWGAQFFVKFPHDDAVVPWHQDAQYWPLAPSRTVTAWIAVYDTDIENAAMQVVRRSHKSGSFSHHANDAAHYQLNQEVSVDQFAEEDVVTLDLKAGEISLHDDGLLHGSGPNGSDRMRAGMTVRFCPTEVKCDLSVWPNFEAYMARGTDAHAHNPVGKIPTEEGYPVKLFQHSSEFV
jgi:non-heme Fe2+,alpha-ketoglutarate-dependent halogenase